MIFAVKLFWLCFAVGVVAGGTGSSPASPKSSPASTAAPTVRDSVLALLNAYKLSDLTNVDALSDAMNDVMRAQNLTGVDFNCGNVVSVMDAHPHFNFQNSTSFQNALHLNPDPAILWRDFFTTWGFTCKIDLRDFKDTFGCAFYKGPSNCVVNTQNCFEFYRSLQCIQKFYYGWCGRVAAYFYCQRAENLHDDLVPICGVYRCVMGDTGTSMPPPTHSGASGASPPTPSKKPNPSGTTPQGQGAAATISGFALFSMLFLTVLASI